MATPKSQTEIQAKIDILKRQRDKSEPGVGIPLNPKHRIIIQLNILEGRFRYSDYSNEKQEFESIAYETTQWMKGEYFDDEAELFGE